MAFETCPLLNDISWVKHGFYGADNPCASTRGLQGIHRFNDDFPETVFLKQDHTDQILSTIDDASIQIADAVITSQKDMALAIKTADCCPVLLICPHSKQIAVVHAGWPGALNQITVKTVNEMVAHGAKAEHIIAAIGPSIHQDTYPVQDDLRDKFMAQMPEAASFFTRFEDRWKMDVTGIVVSQLKSKNVSRIWVSGINTFTDTDYASHRRDHSDPPIRNIGIIMKTGD